MPPSPPPVPAGRPRPMSTSTPTGCAVRPTSAAVASRPASSQHSRQVLDPGLAAAGPDHGPDIEADTARPVPGGAEVGSGQPAELGLLGGVDGGRRGAVAVAPPGLDLAEDDQPGALGQHVDLTRLAAPVAG